jgi:hypothetical protein
MNEWKQISTTIHTVDWSGNQITIHDVPAEQNINTKKIRVNPRDVARTEFTEIAKRLGMLDRDILLFLLLYAKPGPFQRGYLSQKYKINKMLFYQWKELEKIGLGDAIPRDEFVAKARGPEPKNLWDDLKRLHDSELIKVDGGRKQKKTVTVELSDKGIKIASNIWKRIPDPYLWITSRVKDCFFLMTPQEIKKMVHKEYPQYKKTYKILDKEEKLKF